VRGRLYTRSCDAELGDARCGVVLANAQFTASSSIVALRSQTDFTASGLAGFDDGWFSLGIVSWGAGANAGKTSRVLRHSKNGNTVSLTLDAMPPATLVAGQAFSVVAGCDKSFATCKTRFANTLNFRGFPHMPGNDHAYSYISDGMQFDGGPVVQ
jgi:uncharacterized phage protein (TIGR02218 family)